MRVWMNAQSTDTMPIRNSDDIVRVRGDTAARLLAQPQAAQ